MAKVRNRSRTVSIRVSFNFAVAFDFNLFPVSPSKAQFIFYWQCPHLMNRLNAAVWSMVFASFLTRIAY